MKPQNYLISLSSDEFACLQGASRLRVDSNRLIPVANVRPGPEQSTLILMRLPECLERDEHNTLILRFAIAQTRQAHEQFPTMLPDVRYILHAEDCKEVLPLTSRAKSILQSRFSGTVVLSEPIFENAIEESFSFRHQERSFTGANALVRSLVDPEDYQVQAQMIDQSFQSFTTPESLAGKALNYQRRDPMPKEPVSGLRDLGRLLTDTLPDRKPTDPLMKLGDWLKPRRDSVAGFRSVYTDSALLRILDILTEDFRLPTHAGSLGIFLHWRELALRAGGLDLSALEADCKELASCVSGDRIVDALWLLGFSAGFETFASEYYSRLGAGHPFGGGRAAGSKIGLLWPKLPVQVTDAPGKHPQDPAIPDKAEEAEIASTESSSASTPPSISSSEEQTSVPEPDSPGNKEIEMPPIQSEPDPSGMDENPESEVKKATPPGKVAKKAAKKAAKKKAGLQESDEVSAKTEADSLPLFDQSGQSPNS